MMQTYNLSAQETAGFKVILCYILYYSLYQNKDKNKSYQKIETWDPYTYQSFYPIHCLMKWSVRC